MSSTAELSLSLESAAAAFVARFPKLGARVLKGLQAAKAGLVTARADGSFSVVGSAGAEYRVAPGICTCEDHRNRARLGVICGHRFACNILDAAGALPTYQAPAQRGSHPTLELVITPELAAAGAALESSQVEFLSYCGVAA